MNNPYNFPDRAFEKTLANGVSQGIQQAQQNQQAMANLANLGVALWNLSDQKKIRKLQEWVYLVIGKSCLRNPKLQDLVDLNTWVERIAAHGRPTFGVDGAAEDLAEKINAEFRSLGYDVDEYIENADYFLNLKLELQDHDSQASERRRLFGKVTKLPYSSPDDIAALIEKVSKVKASSQGKTDNKDVKRFSLMQPCEICGKTVPTDEVSIYVCDLTIEHQIAFIKYNELAASSLIGEGFNIAFTGNKLHNHLVPDLRYRIADLLDCVSISTFRLIDSTRELLDTFSENGIELLELENSDYSHQSDSGHTITYGVCVDDSSGSGQCDYLVSFSIWNGYSGPNEKSLAKLGDCDFSIHSTGLAIWFECVEGFRPSKSEKSKWDSLREIITPEG